MYKEEVNVFVRVLRDLFGKEDKRKENDRNQNYKQKRIFPSVGMKISNRWRYGPFTVTSELKSN